MEQAYENLMLLRQHEDAAIVAEVWGPFKSVDVSDIVSWSAWMEGE
jgi:hypothetical protein